jgi:hypothetical protein
MVKQESRKYWENSGEEEEALETDIFMDVPLFDAVKLFYNRQLS